MLAQFLDFGRGVDGGCIDYVHVRSAVQAAIAVAEADVTVSGPAAMNGLYVMVRRQSFERALINLIRNAFDHGEPPVSIDLKANADNVEISVRDNGRGIQNDMLPVVIDPFVRGNPSRPSDGGTGLGLAIVARFAREHGGGLELVNQDEGGLAAILRLPIADH